MSLSWINPHWLASAFVSGAKSEIETAAKIARKKCMGVALNSEISVIPE